MKTQLRAASGPPILMCGKHVRLLGCESPLHNRLPVFLVPLGKTREPEELKAYSGGLIRPAFPYGATSVEDNRILRCG